LKTTCTFGATNVREYFPEDKSTLDKDRLLKFSNHWKSCGMRMNGVDWNKILIKMAWMQMVLTSVHEFTY